VLALIEDLPETVVGVEADDKVTAEEYEEAPALAVEAGIAKSGNGRIGLIYVVGHEFSD
jgi:hypothetical protein